MQVPCILGRRHSIHTTGRILIQVVPAGKEKVSVQVPVEVLKTMSLVGSRLDGYGLQEGWLVLTRPGMCQQL
jgi:hypothetical protein